MMIDVTYLEQQFEMTNNSWMKHVWRKMFLHRVVLQLGSFARQQSLAKTNCWKNSFSFRRHRHRLVQIGNHLRRRRLHHIHSSRRMVVDKDGEDSRVEGIHPGDEEGTVAEDGDDVPNRAASAADGMAFRDGDGYHTVGRDDSAEVVVVAVEMVDGLASVRRCFYFESLWTC